jgi:hypothetical protein
LGLFGIFLFILIDFSVQRRQPLLSSSLHYDEKFTIYYLLFMNDSLSEPEGISNSLKEFPFREQSIVLSTIGGTCAIDAKNAFVSRRSALVTRFG